MSDKPKKLDEIDSFWDLESLVPQSRKNSAHPVRRLDTDTVGISSDAPSGNKANASLNLDNWRALVGKTGNTASSPAPSRETKTCGGVPIVGEPIVYKLDNCLITSVTVGELRYPVSFYRNFKSDVKRLWNKTAAECPRVSFFAYVPQHWQLDFHQLNWYVYWRSCVLSGNYPDTDYSYILLFIYEIINSPELIEPQNGLEILVGLWTAYRTEYPKLDQVLGDWVRDYCFIHRLPCPNDRISSFRDSVIRRVKLPEFYIDSPEKLECAAGLITRLASYDWRKSGYCKSENAVDFDRHINGAFYKVYTAILVNRNDFGAKEETISYISYDNALCAPETRRSIEVKRLVYDQPSASPGLVNDIIRYSENRVRAGLGISQRLKVNELPEAIRKCIDEYFDENYPSMSQRHRAEAKKAKASVTEKYDSLYEPVKSDFSLENALEIEKRSWSTTDILTSALGGEDEAQTDDITSVDKPLCPDNEKSGSPEESEKTPPENEEIQPPIPPTPESSDDDPYRSLIDSLDAESLELLKLTALGDHKAAVKVASRVNAFADALVDRINESAVDLTGDQIIEPCDDGYRIIPDYLEELLQCLK